MGRVDGATLTPVAARLHRVRRSLRHVIAARRLSSLPDGSKLHLGCGRVHLDGWVNIDVDASVSPDIRLDLRSGLAARPRSLAFIFSEHLLEHLTLEDGLHLLRDCRDGLRSGGVMRVAMPDLESLVRAYLGSWRDQAWLRDPAYDFIDSAVQMLNHAFYGWGHRYLYDRAEVSRRLREAGFLDVEPRPWGESPYPELRGLETREESNLIVEAVKP